MKKTVSWIVVADHQHARAYAHDGAGQGIKPVEGWEFATHLQRTHDMVSDRPGRKPGVGGNPVAVPQHSDPNREAGRRFMKDIAGAIAKAAQDKVFDRLVLVAPPRALGELRQALPAAVHKMVIAELDEDLTKETLPALAARLGKVLPV